MTRIREEEDRLLNGTIGVVNDSFPDPERIHLLTVAVWPSIVAHNYTATMIDITGQSHTVLKYGRPCWIWNYNRACDMD